MNSNYETVYRSFIRKKDAFYSIQLRLEGVRCINCLNAIERRLNKNTGVKALALNLTHTSATVTWDSALTSLDDIFNGIQAAGFGYKPIQSALPDVRENETYTENLTKLVVALFFTMNLMLISISLWAGFFSGMEPRFVRLFQLLSFVLSTPVIFYSGSGFIRGGYYAVKNRNLNMDFQIAFNALLIYFYSIYAGLRGNSDTYFESAAMFVTFILASKFLEASALKRMRNLMKTLNFKMPYFGRLCGDNTTENISIDQIRTGMELELLAGDAIPADGVISTGRADINESTLTGEYLPVGKSVGDAVYSGTFVQNGTVRFIVEKEPAGSTLHKLTELLNRALQDKPAMYKGAHFFERHFTHLIAVLSLLTLTVWMIYGNNPEQAFLNAVAVFIIACPCALALATPLSYLSGFRLASGHKIILKSASNFESIAGITDIVFDKTGTLTEGKPEISGMFENSSDKTTAELYALVIRSNHILSKTIAKYLEDKTENTPEITEFGEIPGKGLRAVINGKKHLFGSLAFMLEENVPMSPNTNGFMDKYASSTLIFHAVGGQTACIFAVEDTLRKDVAEVCEKISAMGKNIHLCSGDREASVVHFVNKTGGRFSGSYHAQMIPAEKKEFIRQLQTEGKRVLFVGDGLNDSAAMAQADLSIAMNGGIDLAIETADIILLENNLLSVINLFPIANAVKRLIKQNLGMSVIYNLTAVPLAVAGFVIPLAAAASMSVSSLLVVGNSLRLKSFK